MLTIFALDPGSHTGWAASNGTSGAVDFSCKARDRRPIAARHGDVARRFRRWLDAELYRAQAGVLVIERQMMGKGGGQVTLGLRMVALELAAGVGVLVDEVASPTWMAWARREHGWSRADKDDEADARTMLAWWQAVRAPLIL